MIWVIGRVDLLVVVMEHNFHIGYSVSYKLATFDNVLPFFMVALLVVDDCATLDSGHAFN